MHRIEIRICETGDGWVEETMRGTLEIAPNGGSIEQQAMRLAADLGYQVIPNEEGGCNEVVGFVDAPPYVVVTVEE